MSDEEWKLCERVKALEVELKAHAELDEVIHQSEDRARALLSEEMTRRLDVLNNEWGRNREVLNNTVPREVYELALSRQDTKIEELRRFMYMALGAIAVIMALLGILLKWSGK